MTSYNPEISPRWLNYAKHIYRDFIALLWNVTKDPRYKCLISLNDMYYNIFVLVLVDQAFEVSNFDKLKKNFTSIN